MERKEEISQDEINTILKLQETLKWCIPMQSPKQGFYYSPLQMLVIHIFKQSQLMGTHKAFFLKERKPSFF